jgi:cell division septation protein DedD
VRGRGPRSGSPLIGLLGLALLAIPGFALGMLAGVAWEDPGLLLSHVLGRTVEAPLETAAADTAPEPSREAAAPPASAPAPSPSAQALPDVAAAPAAPARQVTRLRPEVLSPGAPAGRFAVQVGSFAESRSAEGLVARLRERGFDAYVSPSAGSGGARWRVRVGPWPSRPDAERAAARLKAEEKLPTWVLDENAV